MNSPARLQRLVRLGIAVAAVLLASAAALLVLRKGQYDHLESEYAAAERASLLLEQFVQTGQIDELPANVVGFAVYDRSGAALVRIGTAPETIGHPDPAGQIERTDRRLRLIRPVGGRMAGAATGGPRAGRGMAQSSSSQSDAAVREADQFVLLDYDLSASTVRRNLENAALIGSGSLTAAVLVLVGLLFGKFQKAQEAQADQQRLARLGEAARTLAHEIRNPLTAAQMQTALLRRLIPNEHHPRLDVVDEELERIRSLTDQVREFLKSGPGKPVPLDPAAIATELADRLPSKIVVSRPDHPVKVLMDPDRFRSVLGNLIRNAAEAGGEDDDVEVRVSTHRTSRHGEEVAIVVADRGPGISREDRERVFDPFYTTKTHGSGVGLAVTRRFVEEVGGTIALGDRRGGGTEVTITLRGYRDESSDR